MSSLSIHRQRDHGGGVSGSTGAKILTPNSINSRNPSPALKKSLSGKENPKPVTRSQKPVIKSVPRVERTAGEGGDSRIRWSTSSAPRGRSQSPSDFIRIYSDLKKDKVSRVSVERKGFKDSRVSELGGSGKRGLSDFKESKGFGVNSDNQSESERKSSGVRVSFSSCNKGVNLSSSLGKSTGTTVNSNFASHNEKCRLDVGLKVEKYDILKSDGRIEKIDAWESDEKTSRDSKFSETLNDKGLSEEGLSTKIGVKFPSKLHEKLTFLEGKVKRIHLDIKRTKEMLDMNNPDATKVILSDIQEKISGIEKAMGNVAGDSGVVGSKSLGNSDEGSNIVEMRQDKIMSSVKDSVKGLKSEELEARLFPHHKLIRNRMSIKPSSESSQIHEHNDEGPGGHLKVEEKSLSPIEENPIALEFLASLKKDESKVTSRAGLVDLECDEVLEADEAAKSGEQVLPGMFSMKGDAELKLTSDERLDEFDDQENIQEFMSGEGIEDTCTYQLNEIGQKTSTGGWFVSEGESVLLAHEDGSCSYYDIANCEDKAVYKAPTGVAAGIWRDCWIIRAAGADGCSGRYVVAASAGNALDSGFCSWDFYNKDVRAFHMEGEGTTTSRTILGPLSNNALYGRNACSSVVIPETSQWWYKPCGPLIVSTASSQRGVTIYDIRDGEQVMQWEVQKHVLAMDYSSPLQWRNRGKVVVAEAETVSLWDVNSLNAQALHSVSSCGRKISALHVNNTDAELGGGVRQRVSSAEAEGNDGVFCTPDSINILDFRHPSGVGLKIPKFGVNVQSVFSRGDSIFVGCSNVKSTVKKQPSSQVQQFSLRKQRLLSTYSLPESSAHSHYSAITQVWGNSNFVMGISRQGLFVFDAWKDDGFQSSTSDDSCGQKAREIIGPEDMFAPSFDYLSSRVLLISRDRPALWRHLLP